MFNRFCDGGGMVEWFALLGSMHEVPRLNPDGSDGI